MADSLKIIVCAAQRLAARSNRPSAKLVEGRVEQSINGAGRGKCGEQAHHYHVCWAHFHITLFTLLASDWTVDYYTLLDVTNHATGTKLPFYSRLKIGIYALNFYRKSM